MKLYAKTGPVVELDEGSVLDIRSLTVNGVNLAPGRAIPDDGDPRIDHSLEGFMFTCGPDHIRHPEPLADGSGRYPLHGSFSSHPAKMIEVGETECTAEIAVAHADGGQSLLTRHWRVDAETGTVFLSDRLTNTGDAAFPAMLMYHMNIAAKLFDDAVRLEGDMLEGGGFGWRFGEEPGGVFCVPATSSATAAHDGWAEMRLGPIASIGGLTLTVRFDTLTLPYLQIWRNQQAPAHVLGIEPVSHRWVGRQELADAGELDMLAPGESRQFGLSFSFA